LSETEIVAKFRAAAEGERSPPAAVALADQISRLEVLPDITGLAGELRDVPLHSQP
jgi:hypothetical protein